MDRLFIIVGGWNSVTLGLLSMIVCSSTVRCMGFGCCKVRDSPARGVVTLLGFLRFVAHFLSLIDSNLVHSLSCPDLACISAFHPIDVAVNIYQFRQEVCQTS